MVPNSLWLPVSVRRSTARPSRSSSCCVAAAIGAVAASTRASVSAEAAAFPPSEGTFFAAASAAGVAVPAAASPALPSALAASASPLSASAVKFAAGTGKDGRMKTSPLFFHSKTCVTIQPPQCGAAADASCLGALLCEELGRFSSRQLRRHAPATAGESGCSTGGTGEGRGVPLARATLQKINWNFSLSSPVERANDGQKTFLSYFFSEKGDFLRCPSPLRMSKKLSTRSLVVTSPTTPGKLQDISSTISFSPSSPPSSPSSYYSSFFASCPFPPPFPISPFSSSYSSPSPSASFSSSAAPLPAPISRGSSCWSSFNSLTSSPSRICSVILPSSSSSFSPFVSYFSFSPSALHRALRVPYSPVSPFLRETLSSPLLTSLSLCSSPASFTRLSSYFPLFSLSAASSCCFSCTSFGSLASPPSSSFVPPLHPPQQRRTLSQRILVEKADDRVPPSADILKNVPSLHAPEESEENNFLKIDRDNPTRLLEHFAALLKKGNLEPNSSQRQLMFKLQNLADELEAREIRFPDTFDASTATLRNAEPRNAAAAAARNADDAPGNFFSRWWCAGAWRGAQQKQRWLLSQPTRSGGGTAGGRGATAAAAEESAEGRGPAPRGVYIHGGVGQGKTMIMDAFFDCLRIKRKMRVHFHQFMTVSVQQRLHELRVGKKSSDPLYEIAKEIRHVARVLCFDEFQVVHITDAMVLKGLFDALFELGVTMIATSNRPPQELYSGGLNRERFLPFVDLLLEKCDVFHIETHKDYRLSKLTESHHGVYISPARKDEEIIKQMLSLTHGKTPHPGSIPVAMGRVLHVPLLAEGVAKFTFRDLCEASVGAADYLAIAEAFHTVFLSDIPDLHDIGGHPNEVRRLINLIDVLYEKHTRVIFDAALPPFRLLGTTETTEEFETLRQELQKKFTTLQAFFDALKSYCTGEESNLKIEEKKWISGGKAIVGLPEKTLQHVFDKLDPLHKRVLPLDNIRAGLLFHMQNFDEEPPRPSNRFLFEGRKSTAPLPTVGYELNNPGASDGANDNKFAYVRTISRIREMISTAYLQAHQKLHGLHDLEAFGLKHT